MTELPQGAAEKGSVSAEHWNLALADLRAGLSPDSFQNWLAPIRYDDFADGKLRLRIPNRFYADWFRARYQEELLELLRTRSGVYTITLDWQVDESLVEPLEASGQSEQISRPPRSEPPPNNLNPKYRFEAFVVGTSNQLAHAASVAAASSPGKRYNPLFIYGGVGLGKTHLLNAVGHRVLRDNPSARILYVSAERFTNEFIWALQNHRIDEFRHRYRSQCDLLLMDDIQFLAEREQTQEEFFHTFNALYHGDKQIVVSSDAFPPEMGKMEQRLVSRLQWGMLADIQAPELDTRVAIVSKKAEQEGISLPLEVAHFLAQTVKSNVRELEGTLLRLAVKAELLRRPIDLELARETLRLSAPRPQAQTTVEEIQRAVCEFFNLRMSDLRSPRRHRSVAHPRMIAMYLCRTLLRTSYTELGERFGGKEHTTVIKAVRKIEHGLECEDRELLDCVEVIRGNLARRRSGARQMASVATSSSIAPFALVAVLRAVSDEERLSCALVLSEAVLGCRERDRRLGQPAGSLTRYPQRETLPACAARS